MAAVKIGSGAGKSSKDDVDDEIASEGDKCTSEVLQGWERWRSVSNVVVLRVPLRASGALGRFLQEMRAGKISDEMWKLYMDRVIRPDDERLGRQPFSPGPIDYIVHRHSIRATQSWANAKKRKYAKG